eukprot:GSMAST32.ASY1.ANO1.395.1 assembled CDS
MLPPPLCTPCRRVVVTGLGVVSPLGVGTNFTWEKLLSGHSAIKNSDVGSFPRGTKDGEFSSKVARRGPQSVPFIEFALAAASEAFSNAGWDSEKNVMTKEQKRRTGVAIGSVAISLSPQCDTGRGYRGISPYFVPRTLINLAAGHVAIEHGLTGPNHATANACASGANSIGDAFRFIQRGDCDMMIAGGSEACVNSVTIAGFCRANALCTKYSDHPSEASRPFDENRSGFVIGEGAAMMFLEEREHALSRGAHIYAEIRGYVSAFRYSGLQPSDVNYVNAHATSTPRGDAVELDSLYKVFGGDVNAPELLVSSTKGSVGHLLGAAGSLEAVFTVLALQHNIAPPTLNLNNPIVYDDVFANEAHVAVDDINVAITNSFGFGGTNATLLFSAP